jgi:hypothetical protein
VYAADSSGGKNLKAGPRRNGKGSCDRGRAETPADCSNPEIPQTAFPNVVAACKQLDFRFREPNHRLSIDDADSGRHASSLSDDRLEFQGDFQIQRPGKAVRYQCTFQRNNRSSGIERRLDRV